MVSAFSTSTQQAQYVGPMLIQCCFSIYNVGPTLDQDSRLPAYCVGWEWLSHLANLCGQRLSPSLSYIIFNRIFFHRDNYSHLRTFHQIIDSLVIY